MDGLRQSPSRKGQTITDILPRPFSDDEIAAAVKEFPRSMPKAAKALSELGRGHVTVQLLRQWIATMETAQPCPSGGDCTLGCYDLSSKFPRTPCAPVKAALPDLKTEPGPEPTSALAVQVGGEHYKSKGIQPVQFSHANNLGFLEGSVVKYVTRWRDKGGITDLEKARHFLALLIELEGGATPA